MKKILLSAACLVVMAAAGLGGYTYYENQKQMDPWLKANLEALSSVEDLSGGEAVAIPCVSGMGSCKFAAVDADGRPGLVTVTNMIKKK